MDIVELVNQFGLPIVIAGGLGYFIFFIWKFVTIKIKPKLGQAFTVLVALIDRVRMLDNDLIRLDQKLNVFIEMKEEKQIEELQDIKHERRKERD
jgi:hypothetical protein|tara:strand:+ start:915 stop:1199 length:285 start_codon:yes stop_codon:yes gene_type:complete